MVRVGEFLATLTLDLIKKQSLVHYQKKTPPTEPSRVAFGRDQGLSLSLLWLRHSSPHKHAHNRSKSLTTHSRGLTQYKCTALDLKPLIAFLLCLFPLVTDLYDWTPVTLVPTTHSEGFLFDCGKIRHKKNRSYAVYLMIWLDKRILFFYHSLYREFRH